MIVMVLSIVLLGQVTTVGKPSYPNSDKLTLKINEEKAGFNEYPRSRAIRVSNKKKLSAFSIPMQSIGVLTDKD